mmetsp:Transcript_41090/g.85793  ORF Transcript_41090/g.85793 Transcript_41090/m.85793 type:complete len:98 (-) Transcript_41090:1017-1310(-)
MLSLRHAEEAVPFPKPTTLPPVTQYCIPVHTFDIYVYIICTCTYCDKLYFCVQDTIVVVPLCPYCIEVDLTTMFPWKTVGMPVPSSSSRVFCGVFCD